jgi:putative SOS response-associated peptidase YedK
VRTFVVLTTSSNNLISRMHDRMPAILNPAGYERWLGLEPDPGDLLVSFRKRAIGDLADFEAGQFAGQ